MEWSKKLDDERLPEQYFNGETKREDGTPLKSIKYYYRHNYIKITDKYIKKKKPVFGKGYVNIKFTITNTGNQELDNIRFVAYLRDKLYFITQEKSYDFISHFSKKTIEPGDSVTIEDKLPVNYYTQKYWDDTEGSLQIKVYGFTFTNKKKLKIMTEEAFNVFNPID